MGIHKINIDHITVGNKRITPVSCVKNLGFWFDNNFKMNVHINKTCNACFYQIYNIRSIRKYLTRWDTKVLVHSLVTSRIDYCNSLLYGVAQCNLLKLQRVQNAAARLVCGESKYCHITPILQNLHWLPVKYRIWFKILLFVFKSVHTLSPTYICNLIQLGRSPYFLRSCQLKLHVPPCTYNKLGERAFMVAGPQLWNQLPCRIRCQQTLGGFKREVKTFLFQKAFNV